MRLLLLFALLLVLLCVNGFAFPSQPEIISPACFGSDISVSNLCLNLSIDSTSISDSCPDNTIVTSTGACLLVSFSLDAPSSDVIEHSLSSLPVENVHTAVVIVGNEQLTIDGVGYESNITGILDRYMSSAELTGYIGIVNTTLAKVGYDAHNVSTQLYQMIYNSTSGLWNLRQFYVNWNGPWTTHNKDDSFDVWIHGNRSLISMGTATSGFLVESHHNGLISWDAEYAWGVVPFHRSVEESENTIDRLVPQGQGDPNDPDNPFDNPNDLVMLGRTLIVDGWLEIVTDTEFAYLDERRIWFDGDYVERENYRMGYSQRVSGSLQFVSRVDNRLNYQGNLIFTNTYYARGECGSGGPPTCIPVYEDMTKQHIQSVTVSFVVDDDTIILENVLSDFHYTPDVGSIFFIDNLVRYGDLVPEITQWGYPTYLAADGSFTTPNGGVILGRLLLSFVQNRGVPFPDHGDLCMVFNQKIQLPVLRQMCGLPTFLDPILDNNVCNRHTDIDCSPLASTYLRVDNLNEHNQLRASDVILSNHNRTYFTISFTLNSSVFFTDLAPLDIGMVLDRSGSMRSTASDGRSFLENAMGAQSRLYNAIRSIDDERDMIKIGFTSFNHEPSMNLFMDYVAETGFPYRHLDPCGCTAVGEGMSFTYGQFFSNPLVSCMDGSVQRVMIVASDGKENYGRLLDELVDEQHPMISSDITFHTLGIGPYITDEWRSALAQVPSRWGSEAGMFFDIEDFGDMEAALMTIFNFTQSQRAVGGGTLQIVFDDDFVYRNSSKSPNLVVGNLVQWNFNSYDEMSDILLNVTAEYGGVDEYRANVVVGYATVRFTNRCGAYYVPFTVITDIFPSGGGGCVLYNATLQPYNTVIDDGYVREGDTIMLNGTVNNPTLCQATHFQLDANATQGHVIQFSPEGLNMSGLFFNATPKLNFTENLDGTWYVNGTWTVPSVPVSYRGVMFNGSEAGLWDGDPLTGTGVAFTSNITGNITFSPGCQMHWAHIVHADGDGAIAYPGDVVNITANVTGLWSECVEVEHVQVDARDGDDSCLVQYLGGAIQGIFNTSEYFDSYNQGNFSSPYLIRTQWTVPAIPPICEGVTVHANQSALWNQSPNSPSEGLLSFTFNTTGNVTFGEYCRIINASVVHADGPGVDAYEGQRINITATVVGGLSCGDVALQIDALNATGGSHRVNASGSGLYWMEGFNSHLFSASSVSPRIISAQWIVPPISDEWDGVTVNATRAQLWNTTLPYVGGLLINQSAAVSGNVTFRKPIADPVCEIVSVSIDLLGDPHGDGRAREGDDVEITVTVSDPVACSGADHIQVNASNGGGCDIYYAGPMSGITGQIADWSSAEVSSVWTVPAISPICVGETVNGTQARLYNGTPDLDQPISPIVTASGNVTFFAPECEIVSVSIGLLGDPHGDGRAREGDQVQINVSVVDYTQCTLGSVIQVDAEDLDGLSCSVRLGGDMIGMSSSGIAWSGNSISRLWTVPAVPVQCEGVTVNATQSRLYEDIAQTLPTNDWFTSPTGHVTFYAPPLPFVAPNATDLQCRFNGVWQPCGNMSYADDLTGMRVQCEAAAHTTVTGVTFSMRNMHKSGDPAPSGWIVPELQDTNREGDWYVLDFANQFIIPSIVPIVDSGSYRAIAQCHTDVDPICKVALPSNSGSWVIPFGPYFAILNNSNIRPDHYCAQIGNTLSPISVTTRTVDVPIAIDNVLSCSSVVGSCSGDTFGVMRLSSLSNGHGATYDDTSYLVSVCCSGNVTAYTDTAVCGEAGVLSLSGVTNAQAQQYDIVNTNPLSSYPVSVCLSSFDTATQVSCSIRTSNCLSGETCVVRMNDTTNAHLSTCADDTYEYRVCCGVNWR